MSAAMRSPSVPGLIVSVSILGWKFWTALRSFVCSYILAITSSGTGAAFVNVRLTLISTRTMVEHRNISIRCLALKPDPLLGLLAASLVTLVTLMRLGEDVFLLPESSIGLGFNRFSSITGGLVVKAAGLPELSPETG